MGGTSAADALDSALTAFRAAGLDTPRLDAEVLLADVLGVSRAQLIADRDLAVQGDNVRRFQDAVRRRAVAREPVAYIVGRRAFRYIELEVDPRVLIPRPETELLVEVGLRLPAGARVLDIGTGSGAVALALADERPDLEVLGSDVSAGALAVAAANGARLGLDVEWLAADLLDGVAGRVDAILCNPPYVEDRERARLAPEIARHEPAGALFAGVDGLDVIRRLLAEVGARNAAADARGAPDRPDGPVGLVALEVGGRQAGAVAELMAGAGLPRIERLRDLAGIERVVVGAVGGPPR